MRPVLEQHAPAVDQPVEGGAIVGAEPAPERQMVGALDDVDRVELDAAVVLGEAREARAVSRRARGRSRCWRSRNSAATARRAARAVRLHGARGIFHALFARAAPAR